MNYDEWNILIRGWNNFLNENLSLSDDKLIKSYVEKLNLCLKKLKNELLSNKELDNEDINYYLNESDIPFKKIDNFLYNDEIKYINDGASRTAYTFDNCSWVLKVAKSPRGCQHNKKEIDISNIKHGRGASDIFVKIYYFDQESDKPWWMICEKVNILSEIKDIEVLKKVFPTFWEAIEDDNERNNITTKTFSDFIVKSLILMMFVGKQDFYKNKDKSDAETYRNYLDFSKAFINSDKENNKILKSKTSKIKKGSLKTLIPDVSKELLYDQMKRSSSNINLKSFEDLIIYDDFIKIKKALGYIQTSDLYNENIGILNSNNPSPNDIRILDFDTSV